MFYYEHKITGEIIGSLNNLRDLIDANGHTDCITDVIMPNKWLGNGIICHCMKYPTIRENYKRISKKTALEIYPDFGQWRHIDDQHNVCVTWLAKIYLQELIPVRVAGFGTAFTKEGKEKREKLQTILN